MTIAPEPAVSRRSIIPWLFPGGLGLVIVVNLVMLWFALGTFPGMVTRNAYEEGRRHNEVLRRDAAIAALGWRVTVVLSPQDGGTVEIRYHDRFNQPISGLEPQATLSRPVGDPVRLPMALREEQPGIYRATLALPHRGAWDVHVVAAAAAVPHETTRRVTVP